MIRYKTDCDDVDWVAMKKVLRADKWDNGRSPEQYEKSFNTSAHVVLAYDDDALIGTVRVLSDGVCNAYVVDVWTHSTYRRNGIATRMMEMVLEQLQGQHVMLVTENHVEFYKSLSFEVEETGMSKVVGGWLK